MKLIAKFQDEDFRLNEVADVAMATLPDGRIVARAKAKSGGEHSFYYDSIKTFANDWEDYEEPKPKRWFINAEGVVIEDPEKFLYQDDSLIGIGNYFETKEEAEKAVEKLKAWKRLKDKGFINEQVFSMNLNWCKPDDDDWKAFHLLFGGEE